MKLWQIHSKLHAVSEVCEP